MLKKLGMTVTRIVNESSSIWNRFSHYSSKALLIRSSLFKTAVLCWLIFFFCKQTWMSKLVWKEHWHCVEDLFSVYYSSFNVYHQRQVHQVLQALFVFCRSKQNKLLKNMSRRELFSSQNGKIQKNLTPFVSKIQKISFTNLSVLVSHCN